METRPAADIVEIPVGAVGLDFAAWRPRPAELSALCSYVLRYGSRSAWKNLAPAEVTAYLAAGIAIVVTWEQAADAWTQGAATGTAHGFAAVQFAESRGYPKGLCIPFAFDTNVPSLADTVNPHATPAQRAEAVRLRRQAEEYGRAAARAVQGGGYTFGVYGDLDVILLLADVSEINWLAGATSWSDPTKPYEPWTMPGYELVHIRQTISGSTPNYDRNLTLRPFRAWLPGQAAPPPLAEGTSSSSDFNRPAPPAAPAPVAPPPHVNDDSEEEPVKYIAITAEGRNPAVVAMDGSGVQMIGVPGDDIANVLPLFGITTGVVKVTTELWDDFQRKSQS